MAMDGLATVSPPVHTTFYSKLQEWILKQQEFEAVHSKAAPLTKVQRKLLLELEQTLIEPEPDAEPQLGDFNWTGLLHEYRAAHQYYPGGGDLLFTEEAVPSFPAVRWRSRVALEEAAAASFPGDTSSSPPSPSFAKKKDAKQYAAKCAVEWLRAHGHMPAVGVRFPKQSPYVQMQMHTPPRPISLASASAVASPRLLPSTPVVAAAAAAKRQRMSSPDSPASPATTSSAIAGARPPSPSSYVSPGGTLASTVRMPAKTVSGTKSPTSVARGQQQQQQQSSPFDADERSAAAEVAALCTQLNWQPPVYKLTQDSQHQGFWSGYAEFETRPGVGVSVLPPADAGRVEAVLGKKVTKEKIAEGLVPYLARALEERQERIRQFTAGMG